LINDLIFSYRLDYTCLATFDSDVKKEDKISLIVGNHMAGKSKMDVIQINIETEIDYLPSNIGAYFPKLNSIDIRKTNLKSFYDGNFKFMTNLVNLYIVGNPNLDLKDDDFNDLRNLQELYLFRNEFKRFPRKLLWQLKKLKQFDARGNKIESLDSQFFKENKHIKKINLSNNKFTSIPHESLKFLKKLTTLSLNENKISQLDGNVFNGNVNLYSLSISNNTIKTLPKKLLSHLVNLVIFDASENQIEFIGSDFFKNNKIIMRINLANNKLKVILVDFTKVNSDLKDLNLLDNVCIDMEIHSEIRCFYVGPINFDKYPDSSTELQHAINANCSRPN